MQTFTWVPGTDKALDDIFEYTRQKQYDDHSHHLWKNYDKDGFDDAVALTIAFSDEFVPEVCSSISIRDCWPANSYRVLNRTWRHTNRIPTARLTISPEFADCARSQIDWLHQNIDPALIFISRQSDNWMSWVIKKFEQDYNMSFNLAEGKYLTCPNECDDTCWQHIIYQGNDTLLQGWKKKD